MRYFSYILFLFPALLFVLLVLVNSDLLSLKSNINLFWIYSFEIPIIASFTIFFGLYVVATWFLIKFSSFFTGLKTKKNEKEILELKAKLQDNQPELIKAVEDNFIKSLDKYKKIHFENIEKYKKENEKVVSNFNFEIQNLKEKLDKINNK